MRHEEVPHQAKGTKLSASAHPRNARIAIIGAGFCGIATAIALIRQGFEGPDRRFLAVTTRFEDG